MFEVYAGDAEALPHVHKGHYFNVMNVFGLGGGKCEYSLANSTAGSDEYSVSAETLVIAAGASSGSITVSSSEDDGFVDCIGHGMLMIQSAPLFQLDNVFPLE